MAQNGHSKILKIIAKQRNDLEKQGLAQKNRKGKEKGGRQI